jgi:hypothetical protein
MDLLRRRRSRSRATFTPRRSTGFGARREAAKEFMPKQSAGAALDRLSVAIADMKRDLGDRLNSIEHHLRGVPAKAGP